MVVWHIKSRRKGEKAKRHPSVDFPRKNRVLHRFYNKFLFKGVSQAKQGLLSSRIYSISLKRLVMLSYFGLVALMGFITFHVSNNNSIEMTSWFDFSVGPPSLGKENTLLNGLISTTRHLNSKLIMVRDYSCVLIMRAGSRYCFCKA